jgi:O-antigen ligase
MEQFLINTLLAIAALSGGLLILRKPYIGLVIIIASLPMIDIVPRVPFASSIFPLVGGLTLGAHLFSFINKKQESRSGSREIFLAGAALVLWMFISDPYAALQPDPEGRVWLFTFLQLLILVWLSSRVMDTPGKNYTLFIVYSIVTGISSFYAVYSGGVADTVEDSIRSAGLAGGANSAARYFLVALIFLYFLQVRQTNMLIRMALFAFMGLIILGVLVTVSRTGILLLAAAVGLLIMMERGGNRPQALVLVLVSITIVWFFADNILAISRSILPSIRTGSDTVGVRYGLWKAGIKMLEDQPLQGVGLGQYPRQLPYYGHEWLKVKYLNKGAHNMYIQIAAETGLIGLFLFLGLLALSLRIFWRSQKSANPDLAFVGQTWMIAFILILIGGMTKHDHYDKLLWFMIGISACPMWDVRTSEQYTPDTAQNAKTALALVDTAHRFDNRKPFRSSK